MKSLTITILLTAVVFLSFSAAFADCPDKVKCRLTWGYEQYKDLGTINTPTCYKFGHGCRPWHCNGYKDTNADYWLNKCVNDFKVKHDPSHSNELLWVTIKGGIVGNYSRELK